MEHKRTLSAAAVNLQSPTSCPRHRLLGSVSDLSSFDYRSCSYAPHGAQQSPSNIQREGTGPGTSLGCSRLTVLRHTHAQARPPPRDMTDVPACTKLTHFTPASCS